MELIHDCLTAVLTPEPDRLMLLQVAHDDAVLMTPVHRELIDADLLRARFAALDQLLAHVLHLEPLDRVLVQMLLLSHVLDRAAASPLPELAGEALGVQRILQERLAPLDLHGAAMPAIDPSHLQLQAALEAAKEVTPRVVHHCGSKFENRDVTTVIKAH